MVYILSLLQAAAAPPGNALMMNLFPIVLMVGILYFLVIMPMRKQQRNQKEMIKTLVNGQTVLTSGGIIGTIVSVNDDTLILRIKPDNLKIQVARNAVTSLVSTEEPQKK